MKEHNIIFIGSLILFVTGGVLRYVESKNKAPDYGSSTPILVLAGGGLLIGLYKFSLSL